MDGRHIKAFGQGSPASLTTVKTVEKFLIDLVNILGMRTLGPAHVYKEEHGGVSGIVVLSTSHVAIHTWLKKVNDNEYAFFSLDVFSCRTFTTEPVQEALKERFSVPKISIQEIALDD